MTAYYNEIDPYAAQWLRNLISAGHIAPGDVDERDIRDVRPSDLAGYTQCHFFAGIGVWSHALRLAGWPDDRPIWTGSCPCQPFSAAGKGGGFDDERHLWPAFHHLIRECRPPVVLGEQVASKDGLAWLDLVQADLEGTGYASAAVDLCAAGVGAPHIRQRLWWVGERLADSQCLGREGLFGTGCADVGSRPDGERARFGPRSGVEDGGLADADDTGLEGRRRAEERAAELAAGPGGLAGGLADADSRERDRLANGEGRERDRSSTGRQQGDRELEPRRNAGRLADATSQGSLSGSYGRICGREEGAGPRDAEPERLRDPSRPRPADGFWRDADWLFCRDGRWRPVEPGTSPLAHGAPARVGRLRAYGNAIVAQAAATFVGAYIEASMTQ